MPNSSLSSSSSSSFNSSDFRDDDIEIDGLPSEKTCNTKFSSIQSTNNNEPFDSLAGSITPGYRNSGNFLTLNSWNNELGNPSISEELLQQVIALLKDPNSINEEQRLKTLEKLEPAYSPNISFDNNQPFDFLPKYTSIIPKSPLHSLPTQPEAKEKVIRINIEIPNTNPNCNDIRCSLSPPNFDKSVNTWRTTMEFMFQHLESNSLSTKSGLITPQSVIQEEYEPEHADKSTQAETNPMSSQHSEEKEFPSIRNSFILLPKPIGYDSRSKSDEKLIYPDILNLDLNFNRTSNTSEVDISYLERFEGSFENMEEDQFLTKFRSSFTYYKNTIQRTLDKMQTEIRRIKFESESLFQSNYDKFNEDQFKRYSQNQLLLLDTEQQINYVCCEINKKDVTIERVMKLTANTQDANIQKELRKTRFAYSIRLINQMSRILKQQVSNLSKEINPKAIDI